MNDPRDLPDGAMFRHLLVDGIPKRGWTRRHRAIAHRVFEAAVLLLWLGLVLFATTWVGQ